MPKQRERIRFSRAELDLINDMAAIASAQEWGEGDYQGWTEASDKPFHSLRDKVWELLDRKEATDA